jgi:hypothetical protein
MSLRKQEIISPSSCCSLLSLLFIDDQTQVFKHKPYILAENNLWKDSDSQYRIGEEIDVNDFPWAFILFA